VRSKGIFFVTLFTLLSVKPVSAQFGVADSLLLNNNFFRLSNKSIISKYLASNSSDSIKAALLSIASAGSFNLFPQLLDKQFCRYSEFFLAIDKQAPDTAIVNFLSRLIAENIYKRQAINSIANHGDSLIMMNLLKSRADFKADGIGLSIPLFKFSKRGIKTPEKDFRSVYRDELTSDDSLMKFNAIFALYRIGPDTSYHQIITEELTKALKEQNLDAALYLLGIIRKSGKSLNDEQLLEAIRLHNDWRIRCEAAKIFLSVYPSNRGIITDFLSLLLESNPNVAVQAAISLRNIDPNKEDLENIIQIFSSLMFGNKVEGNTAQELFISLTALSQKNGNSFFIENNNKFPSSYRLKAAAHLTSGKLAFLIEELPALKPADIISFLNSFMTIEGNEINSPLYFAVVTKFLSSDSAPALSIIADNLPEQFLDNHFSELQPIIIDQVFGNAGDVDYVEAIMSLYNMALKKDSVFAGELKKIIAGSGNSALKNVLGILQYPVSKSQERDTLFADIFYNAFRYKTAKVHTNKGSFTFELLPEYAPISVGNFCRLTLSGYFNENIFHRVVPNFVIQTGDSQGTGWGSPGYSIVSEFSPLAFDRGSVGMASAGKDTEGSQWFVLHGYYPHLNSNYTNFGKIIVGQNIVDIIEESDRIIKIELF